MSRRLEAIALSAVVLAAAAWRFGATVADPDLWGHIRLGHDLRAASAFMDRDFYSYLADDGAIFNHSWLSEVVMSLLHDWLGLAGLEVVKAVLTIGLIGLLMWWLIREGMRPIRAALVMLLGVLALTPTFGTFRPQLFTVVLFVVLLLLIQSADRGRLRVLWLLPPFFALWVNLHGGVLGGLVVLGTWALIYALLEKGRRRWWPMAATVGSIAAMGLNPYGYAHLTFLLETATVARPEIQDWQPTDLGSPAGIAYLVLAALVVIAVVAGRSDLRLPIVVPLVALAVAPFLSVRHLQLFVPALVVLGGSYLAGVSGRIDGETGTPDNGARPALALTLAIVVALAGWAWVVRSVADGAGCIEVESGQFEFPMRAVHALVGARVTGNAVVPFNWGSYVIWHLGPELRVSIDGRRETAYSDDVLQADLDFIEGEGEWDRLLGLAPANVVLVPSASPAAELMRERAGWEVAYDDPVATVFAPTDSPITLTPDGSLPIDGDGACFPA